LAGLAGLALLLAAAGCSDKHTPIPVSGEVTLDGQPVEAATVYFYAVGDLKEGRTATGQTDKEGKFRLSTLGTNDGALPGNYKVVVSKYVPSKPNLKIPDFPNTQEGKAQRDDFMYRNFEAQGVQPFKSSLPAKYGNSDTTPLSCEVSRATTVKLELVSK